MKKILLISIVFITGCGYDGNTNSDSTSSINRAFVNSLIKAGKQKVIYTTKVISDPPGARIELDDDYIGDAPLEIKWEGWSDSGLFVRDHELRALPIYQGQYVQQKHFNGDNWGFLQDSVPKRILFDMRLGPIPKQYEIDID